MGRDHLKGVSWGAGGKSQEGSNSPKRKLQRGGGEAAVHADRQLETLGQCWVHTHP